MDIKDKSVLITGGTRGIGAATAVECAKRGAHIAIIGRTDGQEARATCSRVVALGVRCELIVADMGRSDDVRRCVEHAVEKFGGVDMLVHSAGGPANGTVLDISEEDWNSAFDVHVHAVFHLCRSVIPLMQRNKEGSIVLISSAAGLRGCPRSTCYQVVKGALPQFARALAFDFSADNIRVNCVAPGIIRTAFHAAMTEDVREHNIDNRIPLHREGTSEQVASLIVELSTNDFITGETVVIDGGMTMRIV